MRFTDAYSNSKASDCVANALPGRDRRNSHFERDAHSNSVARAGRLRPPVICRSGP